MDFIPGSPGLNSSKAECLFKAVGLMLRLTTRYVSCGHYALRQQLQSSRFLLSRPVLDPFSCLSQPCVDIVYMFDKWS
jgi:hypothetical protein